MTKTNRKSILTITAAVFGAIILSLTFILIVNAGVTANATPVYNIEYTAPLTIPASEIEGWFTLEPVDASGGTYRDESLVFSDMTVSAKSGDPTGSFGKESNAFVYTPSAADAGKTIIFTFNVQGNNYGSQATIDVTVNIKAAKATPSITINLANETLTGFTAGESYTIGGITNTIMTETIAIDESWIGTSLTIIHKGDDNHSDSPAQTLEVPDIRNLTESLRLESDGLYYDGVLLEENTAYPFLGGGSYSYNSSEKILSLTGVNFTTSSHYVLLDGDTANTTFNLSGSNSFISTYSSSEASLGIYSDANLTITGNGSLTAVGGDSTVSSDGIYVTHLYIASSTVTVTARGSNETDSTSYGISGACTLTSGKIIAEGKTAALSAGLNLPAYYRYKIGNAASYTYSTVTEYLNDGVTSVTIEALEVADYALTLGSDGKLHEGSAGGTVVPSGSGVLGGGTYSYSGSTLTITDVNFVSTAETALDLTAVSGAKLNFSGTNTVTSTYSATNASYGIKAIGTVFIDGTGSLTATAGNATSTTSTGIYNTGDIYIQGGTVTAIGGNGSVSQSFGIMATGGVYITGGSVTATGRATQGHGINADGLISIQSGAVTATGYSNALNKDPSKPVSYDWLATQGSGNNDYSWAYSDKTVTITTQTGVDTSTVTYNKYNDFGGFDFRYSLANGATFTSIKNGDTTLEEGNDKDYYISENLITVSYGYLVTLPNTGATLTFNTSDGINPEVEITFNNVPDTNPNGLVLNATAGELQIDGTEATMEDLGGGSYEWNGTTKTLTLTDVHFTSSVQFPLDLTAIANVNLIINGENSFTSVHNSGFSTYTIMANGTLTISGTGSLTVVGSTANSGGSCAIDAHNVIINGGNLSLSSQTKAIRVTEGQTATINMPKYSWTTTDPADSGAYPDSALTIGTQKAITITAETGVNPTAATYNKYTDFDGLAIRYSIASGETLESISYNDIDLEADEDYTISGNTVTISYEYIKTLPNTGATLTFNTSDDVNPTVAITFDNEPVTNTYALVLTTGGKLQINGTDATQADLGGGSYEWNGTSKTLTLTDVIFTTTAGKGIDLSNVGNLILSIDGTNSITSNYASGNPQGLYSSGNVTINGTGSLTAATGNSANGMCGVQVGTLTVNSGEVTVFTGNGGSARNRGLLANEVTINGGTVTITSGAGEDSYAVRANSGALKVTGGTLTATASTAENSYGLSASGNIIITGGTVTASASGTDAALSKAPTLPAAYKYKTTSEGVLTNSSGSAPTFTTYAYIETATGVTPTATEFNKFNGSADLTIRYSLESGTTLDSITNGENTLTENTHYTVANNIVTIKGSYLMSLNVGRATLKFNTSGATDPEVALTVINRNPAYDYLDISELNTDTTTTVENGETLYVIGTKGSSGSPANFGLTFNIEAGGNVIWDDAEFTTSDEIAVTVNKYSGTKGNFELKSGEINVTGTGASRYALSNYANLTITGGTVSAASSSNLAFAISNNPGASLTINDGLVSANSSIWSYGIWNDTNATALINGGTIAATGNGNGSEAFTNNGTVTVKGDATVIGITHISAGNIPVSFSENAVSIKYDKNMTSPVLYSTNGLTTGNGGAAVWNTVGGKYGITWRKGTNTGFFEIDGVTVTANVGSPSTIDISFADTEASTIQYNISPNNSSNVTVTGENTSADFALDFVINGVGSTEVIWDGAKFVTTRNVAVVSGADVDFEMNSGVIVSTSGSAVYNQDNATIKGTVIGVTPLLDVNPPILDGDYVIITLPDPIGTYEVGSSTDLTVAPASATAVWDKQGNLNGISWENGTNTGFIEIPGLATTPKPVTPPPNLGEPDIAPPPRRDDSFVIVPEIGKDPDDQTGEESNLNLKVNGEMTDTGVALPVEPGDKTADVKIDGKTVETYSLTAAEAIADGEVTEAFVSPSGAIAAVTVGGNVIAGGNESGSLNSASTIEALEAAAKAAAETALEAALEAAGETDSEETIAPEIPLITINAGQEVTGVSNKTIEKILAVSDEYGVDTQIQKTQYSVDENEQIDELIYRITIPVSGENVRDIRLGAEFSTKVVEASKIAFEKTFGNTDCAGFALTQKETFGTIATIQVKMSAIGFEAKAGDTVYVAIFDPKTGEFVQVEGTVGDNGFITFRTDKSGVIVISATSFIK